MRGWIIGRVVEQRLIPFLRRILQRRLVSPDKLRRYRQPLRSQLFRKARNRIGRTAARRIASVWTKFVPILNVLSIAYDIASTGCDIHKTIDEALGRFSRNPNIYEVFPDLAIEEPDGRLQNTYGFQFDGHWYRNVPDELYDEAMRMEGVQNPDVKANGTVSPSACECDGARRPSETGV